MHVLHTSVFHSLGDGLAALVDVDRLRKQSFLVVFKHINNRTFYFLVRMYVLLTAIISAGHAILNSCEYF